MNGLMQPGPTLYEESERRKKKGSQGLLSAVGEPLSYAPGPLGLLGNAMLGAQYLTGEKAPEEGAEALAMMTGLLQGTKVAPVVRAAKAAAKTLPELDDKTYYHGTTKNFKKFKPSKDGEMGDGIYTAPDPMYAGAWARGEGANIRPVRVPKDVADYNELNSMKLDPSSLGHHKPLDDLIERIVQRQPDWRGNEELLVDHLRSVRRFLGSAGLAKMAGYKGIRGELTQIPGQVSVFDPEDVVSVFDKRLGLLGK